MSDTNKSANNQEAEPSSRKRPGFWKIVQSVLAGALGVQSSKRRDEDFESGRPLPYIIAAIIFVTIFVVTIALIVRWVISTQAG